jgi:hypothetical protein
MRTHPPPVDDEHSFALHEAFVDREVNPMVRNRDRTKFEELQLRYETLALWSGKEAARMKKFRLISGSFVIVMTIFSLYATSLTYAIEVTPLAYDFGEVEVGTSRSTIITIVNYTGHNHILTAIAFTQGSSTDFSLATEMQLPMVLESLGLLEVEVVFSPSVPGPLTADLEIISIDNGLQIVIVSLQGGTGHPPSGGCAPSR